MVLYPLMVAGIFFAYRCNKSCYITLFRMLLCLYPVTGSAVQGKRFSVILAKVATTPRTYISVLGLVPGRGTSDTRI
nr:MAG TPA: hypothetical protein [Caudoviricetes sp.]